MSAQSPDSPLSFGHAAVEATLGRSTDVDSCSALSTRIDTLLDQAISHFQDNGAAIACRDGCNFCCHLRVMVYPHEAIALHRHLGTRMSSEQARSVRTRLLENAEEVRRRDREGLAPAGVPCAFLVGGRCAAYAARPSSCAGYHSLDAGACEAALDQPIDALSPIPHLEALRYTAATLEEGIETGLSAQRLDGSKIELHTAVAALIRNPSLIARWRSGKNLLRGS